MGERQFQVRDRVRATLEGNIITIYPDGIAWISFGENGTGVLVALDELELATNEELDLKMPPKSSKQVTVNVTRRGKVLPEMP